MKITFLSDFACPWCWIGETNLEAALKSLGRAAEFENRFHTFVQRYFDPQNSKVNKKKEE